MLKNSFPIKYKFFFGGSKTFIKFKSNLIKDVSDPNNRVQAGSYLIGYVYKRMESSRICKLMDPPGRKPNLLIDLETIRQEFWL